MQGAQATLVPCTTLPSYGGTCPLTTADAAPAVTYQVTPPDFLHSSYLYDFSLTVPLPVPLSPQDPANWKLGAIEIPLFDKSAIIAGTVQRYGFAGDPGWTDAIVARGDVGWDWTGPKASWGDVMWVLKISASTDPNLYSPVPGTENLGFSFRSNFAPTDGPYQLALSNGAFTFIDPPVPSPPAGTGSSVPEPSTLALLALCLTLPILRARARVIGATSTPA